MLGIDISERTGVHMVLTQYSQIGCCRRERSLRSDECRYAAWSQPPYDIKDVNSDGGTKLVQFAGTACKHLILRRIKWWPETGSKSLFSNGIGNLHIPNSGGNEECDRMPAALSICLQI